MAKIPSKPRARGASKPAKAGVGSSGAGRAQRGPENAGPAPHPKARRRQAERRQPTEIQTGPAPGFVPAAPAQSAAPVSWPEPEAAPPPAPRASAPPASAQYPTPDVEALARNIAQAIEQGGKALAAYLLPRETGEIKTTVADDMGEMVRSIARVAEYYMADPQRAFAAQTALTKNFVDLWASTLQRLQGEQAPPVATPDATDKRFADAAWRDNPYFDFIKQAYVLTTRWADDLVKRADELDPHDREKAQFYLRQVTAALSPLEFPCYQSGTSAHDLAEAARTWRGYENAGRGHRGRQRQYPHPPDQRRQVRSSESISPPRRARSSSATT